MSPGVFTFFPNFDFQGVNSGVKGQKVVTVTLHISGSIHHMIVIFGTHV